MPPHPRLLAESLDGHGAPRRPVELEELPGALRWGMTAFVDIEVE